MPDSAASAPGVLVVLVTHDGAEWLPRVLHGLDHQTYPNLDIIAVDNVSQDGGRDLLIEYLGEDRVFVADRDLGFGAAVSMGLDARAGSDDPFVLVLHDDCALAPDAIEVMVDALTADPRLAAVGPKLRSWHAERDLQSVGWTVDITGRADSGVDVGELDQGQRDLERRALYVSTAAMLLRREAFEAVGRFDRRFHVFRDDLDLCWRFWLAGYDVEVVPDAVARHVAGATNYLRLGQTRFLGPRYFAERNTLATLLKNNGPARLLAIVPLYFLVGIAKVLGFLLTRRVSDAWQTIRAWIWNVLHLRETWRLRRVVQQSRQRQDKELRSLFGKVIPRVRAYVEAIAEWVAGADIAPAPSDEFREHQEPREPETATRRVVAFVQSRPILVVGVLLGLLVIVGAWDLIRPGTLRGGDLAPWPAAAGAFLSDYLAGWHEAGAFGTADAPSPAQALLGLLQALLFGSDYLAARALLLGSFGMGWLLALRTAQTYSSRRLPRVVAATAYVLSPPALAALTTGEIGALVVLAVLPGIIAGGITLAMPRTPPKRAWRAVAGVALLSAIGAAFEPLVLAGVITVGGLMAVTGGLLARDAAWRRALLARTGVATFGPLVLLLPWSIDLIASGGLFTAPRVEPVGGPLWQWLLLTPDLPGMPGPLAGVGFLLAGVLGLVLGFGRSPKVVSALWLVALIGAVGGWSLDRAGVGIWAGLPLYLTAAAFAGLLALAFASAEAQLIAHDFGWRQIAALGTAAAVAVSLATVATALVREPWDAYTRGPTLPSFVERAAADGEPFRVLVLADTADGVSWEVVDGTGPTMAAYGLPRADAANDLVRSAVDDLLARRDPGAAARLAALNIRYVTVPPGATSSALDTALLTQEQLEPRPVAEGRVLTVVDALPRAAVVDAETADRISAFEPMPREAQPGSLEAQGDGRYVGTLDSPGTVVIAEAADAGWQAEVDGTVVSPSPGDTVRFDDLPAGQVEITHTGTQVRTWAVLGQVLAVLLAFSLALRPPGFARSFGDEPDDQWEEPTDDLPDGVPASEAIQAEAELVAGAGPLEPADPGDPEARP